MSSLPFRCCVSVHKHLLTLFPEHLALSKPSHQLQESDSLPQAPLRTDAESGHGPKWVHFPLPLSICTATLLSQQATNVEYVPTLQKLHRATEALSSLATSLNSSTAIANRAAVHWCAGRWLSLPCENQELHGHCEDRWDHRKRPVIWKQAAEKEKPTENGCQARLGVATIS